MSKEPSLITLLKKLQQIQVAERSTAIKKQKDFQSIDKIKIYNNKLFKISTISILLIFCLPLTYYFHFILKTDAIFTHFYYIPIVLSSLWWTYKSIIISAFLSSILLVLQIVAPIHAEIYINITRVLMFLTLSIIISFLIEKKHLLEGKLRTYGKSLEQKIYEWEESYKKFEESANKPIILIGPKGKLLSLNNCAASNLGGKPKDYISKTLWDILPKKVADERFKDHQKVIQSGRSNVKEITVSFKGIEYYYLSRIQPIRNKSGDINSVLILDNDITDRKKAEKYLVESEERYRSLFENTGAATVILEENTVISMTNTQFEKLSGYSKSEIENKMKWTDFVLSEDLEKIKKYHIARRKARKKPPTEYEFHFIDRKGKIKNIFLKVGIVPGSKKIIASLMDITERKQVEERVKHLNLVLRAIRSINQLIVKEKNREKLLKGLCNNLIETRGYYSAWIVLLDESGKLETYAEAGIGKAFLPMVEILKKGESIVCGQKALKQQEVVTIKDPASTCPECPLVKQHPGRRAMTTRLEYSGKIYGFMSVSIPDHLADYQEEQSLFKEVAVDIAFSMHNIELDEELKDSEERLKILFDYTPDPYYIIDSKGNLIDGNIAAEKLIGYKKEELIGKNFLKLKLISLADISKSAKAFAKNIMGQPMGPDEFVLNRKDNSKVTIETSTYPVKIKGRTLALGIARDITERKQSEERLKKTMDATIETVSKIVEAKDPYTAGHQQRVSQLTTAIAKELNLSQDKIKGIRIASLIHDIGKISVPTEILSKSIALSDIEFSLIKGHSQTGYDILKSIDFSYPIARIVLQHHERLNGSGYPNNLKGDKILLEAKILGVADVVEAMSSHRPYRPALGIDKDLEEISQNKGTLYDPEVVDACLKLFEEKGFKFK